MLSPQGQHLGKSWSNGELDHGPPKGSDVSQGNSSWLCIFLRQCSKAYQKLLCCLSNKKTKTMREIWSHPFTQTVPNMADSFLTSSASLGGEVGKGKFITLPMFKACIHEMEINIHKQFHSPTQQPRQLLQATFIHGLQGFIQRVRGPWNSPSPPSPQKSWN